MSNSSGAYYTTPENAMKAFDKLPPSARKALAEAAFNYAPQPIVTRWRRGQHGYRTGPEIADAVARWDRKRLGAKP